MTVERDEVRIDWAKRFLAEEFTPLFHCPEYGALPTHVRLRYNQLHAMYFNEQVTFFEQEMLSPCLLALRKMAVPHPLAEGLRDFFAEEQRHTAMFRALNFQCAPEFYSGGPYYFVRVAYPWRVLLKEMACHPRMFPMLIWLALMQEERSLFYAKGCLAMADGIEPHFLETCRTHLADEVGHVGWDEELLDWLWPQTGRAIRRMNVWLLHWMVGEFFLLPKRSGLRVVHRLGQEFPELDAVALERAMERLKGDCGFLQTLYSRKITPRTFARFDADPEFARLGITLPGYRPRAATNS